jgi:hypothetical protein
MVMRMVFRLLVVAVDYGDEVAEYEEEEVSSVMAESVLTSCP